MNHQTSDTNTSPDKGTVSAGTRPPAFPENLPPRPLQSEHRSGIRTCLTCGFLRSYSFKRQPDRASRARRASVIINLLFALTFGAWAVFLVFAYAEVGSNTNFVAGIIFSVIDFFFLWMLAWSFAIIGDAVGTRRVLGMNVGRKSFDGFLWVCVIGYAVFFIVSFFGFLRGYGFEVYWLLVAVLIFGVAWIAGEPPAYPDGRV